MDNLMLVLGTGLLAASIQFIYDPVGMVVGGFTGLAIIIKSLTEGLVPGGVPLWLTNLCLNIPVFLLSWRFKGREFIGRTLLGTFLLSAWLYVLPAVDLVEGDYTLAAVFGGLLGGAGMGLILLAKATTGGTDMVATLIQMRMKHHSVVWIIQVLDGLIVLAGLYVFGLKTALYAMVAIFITTKVSDALMEGFKFAKVAFIITDRYEEIAQRILAELDRGVTALHAKGMYSGEEKLMLYCVVSQKQIVSVKEIVAEVDPNAFVIVSDAREVLGEGFLNNADEETKK